MPSTYSTNTGLEIIATGEKSGSWGDITNGNLNILDAAINGGVVLDLTGEGSSYDLDTSNWLVGGTDVSEGQYKLITLTGGDDPGSGNRITINIVGDNGGTPRTDLEKLYFVTTSSLNYGVEFSTGSGTAKVNIDDGDFKIIYSDGSDEVKSLTDDLTISSIKVTGGSIDDTSIGGTSPSTGSFSNLIATDGTLDDVIIGGTTPAAGDFTAFTVSAAGSTFTVAPATTGTLDDVTIGATTPAVATVTTLNVNNNADVTGNLTVDGNVTLGDAGTDTVTVNSKFATSLLPSGTTMDLGSSSDEWRDLYITGTANVDSLSADTADINGGTIDNVTIGGTTAGDATFDTATITTLNATTVNASNFYEGQTSPTISGSTFTLDANTASLFYCSHAVGGDVTFNFTNVPASGRVFTATLIHHYNGTSARTGTSIYQNGGSAVTVYWPGGSAPSEPGVGQTDVLTLFTYDGGSTWYGGLSGLDMS